MSALKKLAPAIAAGVATAGLSIILTATPASATCIAGTQTQTDDCIVGVVVDGVGSIEVGAGAKGAGGQGAGEVYVVAADSSARDLGYIGVSNYENGSENNVCQAPAATDGNEGGTLTNSGGCYGGDRTWIDLRGGPLLVVSGAAIVTTGADVAQLVPLPVSGDDTGDYNNSSRDGARDSTLNVLDGGLAFLDDFCDITLNTAPFCPVA